MAEGKVFGIDRPFVEDEEEPIKLIVKFAKSKTQRDVRRTSQGAIRKLEDSNYIVSDVQIDGAITPIMQIEMSATNLTYDNLDRIREVLTEMDGFNGLTTSTVDYKQVGRFARMR